MGEALEHRVAPLGSQGAGPGFPLAHLALELMEDLLDVPAVFVEQDDLRGGQGEVVGQVGVAGSVLRIDIFNPPGTRCLMGSASRSLREVMLASLRGLLRALKKWPGSMLATPWSA